MNILGSGEEDVWKRRIWREFLASKLISVLGEAEVEAEKGCLKDVRTGLRINKGENMRMLKSL